jgi:cytochrome oxidase Cu insertion factor (SCO1/SenC/PrrC family)
MKKSASALLSVILISVLAGVSRPQTSEAETGPSVSGQPMIGEVAPGFDLELVGGGRLSLDDLKGRYVVMHFGASW